MTGEPLRGADQRGSDLRPPDRGGAAGGGRRRPERQGPRRNLRFYELAKKQEWQVRDLPWGEVPPILERALARIGGAQGARRAVWRSVITQQLQADQFAVEMAAQFNLAPHREQ